MAGANLDPVMVKSLALRAAAKLGDHVHVLHDYTDKTLALRETMTLQMQKVGLDSVRFGLGRLGFRVFLSLSRSILILAWFG